MALGKLFPVANSPSPWVRAGLMAGLASACFLAWAQWSPGPVRISRPLPPVPEMRVPAENLEQAWARLHAARPRAEAAAVVMPLPPALVPPRVVADEPVAEPLTADEVVMAGVYADFDARLTPGGDLPAWAARRDFHAEVARADSNASLISVACTEGLCRLVIANAGGSPQDELAGKLGMSITGHGSSVLYRYPAGQPTRLTLYVMNAVVAQADLDAGGGRAP